MLDKRFRNIGLSLAAGSMLAFAGAGEAAAPDLTQIYQPNQINIAQVSNSNVFNSNNNLSNPEKLIRSCITKDTFSSIPNMQRAAALAADLEKQFNLPQGSVLKTMNDFSRQLSSRRDSLINERFVSHNELDDLNGPKKVYFPVMRKISAKNQDELSAVCWDPNNLGKVNYVKNNQPNQSYGAFCLQKYYQDKGLDSLNLVMSPDKVEAFHNAYGDLNQINALIVPFYSSRSDMRMTSPERDSSFDFRMNAAINNRLSYDGFAAYDRGPGNNKGYKLNSEQVELIAYEYGLSAVESLQHMKSHFFTNEATQLIDQMFKESNAIYGTSYSIAKPFLEATNVKQMSTTASLSKAQEILRDNGIQNSDSNSLGTVKVGNQEYALSDGLYRGGTVKLDYAVNGFNAKLVSDNVPMAVDDLGRSVALSKEDIEKFKALNQKVGKESSSALGRGNDMSDFKVQYSEAERNSFKNLSAAAMSNQNSAVEIKTLHVPVVKINPLVRIPAERQVTMVAHKELDAHMKANGEFRHNLRPNVDYRIDKITSNGDGTYNCDITYNVEKQQENIVNQGVKATEMSTAGLNKVQTEGAIQPPPPDRPMVMDDTGKMHSMTNDELNVVKNAETVQKSEKEGPSVSSSGHSYFVSVDDDKHVGFEQTDYYVKCSNADEALKIAKLAAEDDLSRHGRLQDDSAFRTLGKPELTEHGYKITVEARNVKEDILENIKSAEFSVDRDAIGNSKSNIILRRNDEQKLTQENSSKAAESASKEKFKEKNSSRDRGNCLE